MAPNGLIFVLIGAVWAAYFAQHWIRRREHLATARSMDRFSASMRVLATKSTAPMTSVGAPPPRSYAVSPARVVRPEVVVKRAEPMVARPVQPATGQRPLPSSRPAAQGPRRVGARAPRPSRAVRGLVFLGHLALAPILAVLAVVGLVSWWTPLLALVAASGALLWVRDAAAADRARRGAARPARPVSQGAASAGRGRDSVASTSPVAEPSTVTVTSATAATSAEVSGELATEQVYDLAGADRPAAADDLRPTAAAPLLDEDDMPLTWDPRPVPPPTYTLKATARMKSSEPVSAEPAPSELEDERSAQHAAYGT